MTEAVLAELPDASDASGGGDSSLERALEALGRLAPTVPVWLYIALEPDAVREVARLAARGLVADVMTADENLGASLLELLRRSHSWNETAALWIVWQETVTPDTRDVIGACIAASARAATVDDVARRLNESPRTLERQVAQSDIPPVHRVVSWCRLLRAMYRLDQPGANVKAVAAELGYPSSHAMLQHLHRHTGLTISGLRPGGGFEDLALLCLQAELFGIRARGRVATHGVSRGRQCRKVGPR